MQSLSAAASAHGHDSAQAARATSQSTDTAAHTLHAVAGAPHEWRGGGVGSSPHEAKRERSVGASKSASASSTFGIAELCSAAHALERYPEVSWA